MLYLISKLIIIFEGLLFLFSNDYIEFYIIAFLIILAILLFRNTSRNPKNIFIYQLIDFKIISWFEPVIVLVIYILIFIIGILAFRLWRIGNSLDMKFLLLKLYTYVSNQTFFLLLFKIIFLLLILIYVLKGLAYFFKQVKINFTKIILHPAIFNVYSRLGKLALASGFFRKLISKVLNKIHWSDNKFEDIKRRGEFLKTPYMRILLAFSRFLDQYLANIVIFIAFIYDIVFNDMKLTMVFYVIPFAFIYIQYVYFIGYVTRKDFLNKDKLLSTYLYKKPSHIIYDGMYYDNNVSITKEDLNQFVEYMKKDFMEYENKENNSIPLLRGLRIIVLILSIVMLIYLSINIKVFIVINISENFIYKVSFSYIIFGMLLILFYLWWITRICFSYTVLKEVSLTLKILNKLFWIIALFLNLLAFYILLTHRIVLMYNEVLFDCYYIIIMQEYNVTEKLNFIHYYVDYLLYVNKYSISTKIYIINILKTLEYNSLITQDISIEKIKVFIDKLLFTITTMEDKYFTTPSLIEKDRHLVIRNPILEIINYVTISLCIITLKYIFENVIPHINAYENTAVLVKGIIKQIINLFYK